MERATKGSISTFLLWLLLVFLAPRAHVKCGLGLFGWCLRLQKLRIITPKRVWRAVKKLN